MNLTRSRVVDPAACLPHRGAMLLVDRVVSSGAERAVGEHDVASDAFWAAGHFPGSPILPGVLQIEFAAQLCGIVLGHDTGGVGARLGALARVRSATFRALVAPVTVLRGDVRLDERKGRMANFSFQLSAHRTLVADGRLSIALS